MPGIVLEMERTGMGKKTTKATSTLEQKSVRVNVTQILSSNLETQNHSISGVGEI